MLGSLRAAQTAETPRGLPLRHRGFWIHLAMLPSAALLGLLVIVPLVMLAYYGFKDPTSGRLTLENYDRLLHDHLYVRLLGRSVWLALEVTVASIAIGWP